jgi:hypothetical protein
MAAQPVVNKEFRNKAKGLHMGRTKPINVTKGLQECRGQGATMREVVRRQERCGNGGGIPGIMGHSEVSFRFEPRSNPRGPSPLTDSHKTCVEDYLN